MARSIVHLVAYDNADIMACTPWDTERNTYCSVRVEEFYEGQTVTGTMLEVHGNQGLR